MQRLPSAAHRFPGLSTLDVTFLAASKKVQNLLNRLQHITGLRSLGMYYTLSQLPVGQQFMLQQSQLTSFRASSLEYNAEFPQLTALDIVRYDEWAEDAIVTMFEMLKPQVKLGL
ncbi:hypothetical protein WJX79_001261 [Trebouxia sp. C0005]